MVTEAGRISLPSEGQRSPIENILIGGGATARDILAAATRPGGSLGGGGRGGRPAPTTPSAADIAAENRRLIEETRRRGQERIDRLAREKAAATLAATRTQTALRDQGTSRDRSLSRQDRVNALIRENRESGILTDKSAAERVIRARESSERRTTERATRITEGPTGEVLAVEPRTIPGVIRSVTTRRITGQPTGAERIADVAGRIAEVEEVTELNLFGRAATRDLTREQRTAPLKEFAPVRVFEFAAEGIVRGGEFLGGLVTGTSGRIEPKSRAITKQIIEDILIFQTFAPVIKTATTQQLESQFADEVVEVVYKGQKVKMTASQAKALGLTDTKEITRLQATTLFKTKSAAEQEQTIKLIFEKFNKITFISDADKVASLKRIVDFMRQSGLSDAQIKARLATVFGQQAQTSTVLIAKSTGGANQALLSQTTGVQLEQLPQVLTSVSLLQSSQVGESLLDPAQVGQTAFLTTTELSQESLSIQDQQAQQQQGALQLFGPATAQDTKQSQAVMQLFGPAQAIAQDTEQDQITRQAFVPTTAQLFGQDFGQPQIPQQGQDFGGTGRPVQRPPTSPPTPIPLFGDTTPAKRAVKELAKVVKGDFEIFARVKGEDISIGKAKTKKKAAKKLSKRLLGTLAASGFIEESGRRLTAIETGLIDGNFRVGRLDITRVVQKKETRLGTATETEQIQFFRKTKGGGNLFGSSSKRKRRSNSGFSFL